MAARVYIKSILLSLLLVCCVLFSAQAQIIFQRTYGGDLINEGRSVKQTLDGGYIIAGSTSSFGYGSTDVLLIKTDSLGNGIFMKTYGGPNVDKGYSVLQLSDSGYVVAGYTNSFGNGGYDAYLIRTDKDGDTLWTKTYGGTDWDFVYSLKQASDGGFVMAGNTYSYGNGSSDGWVFKTDSNGNLVWQKVFVTDDDDFFNSVDSGFNGCWVAAGYKMNGDSGSEDIIAARISGVGDSLWYLSYGDTLNEEARVIHSLSDSTYLLGGRSFDSLQSNSFLMKIDTLGSQIWYNLLVTNQGTNDLYDFIELPDSFVVLGSLSSGGGGGGIDINIVFANKSGGWIYGPTCGGAGDDYGYSISKTSPCGYIIAGETNSEGPGLEAAFLVKTDCDGHTTNMDSVIIGINLQKDNDENIYLFPNPTHAEITINISGASVSLVNSKLTFQLYNSLGEMVEETVFNENSKTLSLKNISVGLYFYRILAKESVYSKGKLVIE